MFSVAVFSVIGVISIVEPVLLFIDPVLITTDPVLLITLVLSTEPVAFSIVLVEPVLFSMTGLSTGVSEIVVFAHEIARAIQSNDVFSVTGT